MYAHACPVLSLHSPRCRLQVRVCPANADSCVIQPLSGWGQILAASTSPQQPSPPRPPPPTPSPSLEKGAGAGPHPALLSEPWQVDCPSPRWPPSRLGFSAGTRRETRRGQPGRRAAGVHTLVLEEAPKPPSPLPYSVKHRL